MSDRALGAVILIGSLTTIAIYFYLVFLSAWSLLVVQVSAFFVVSAILFFIAWIGYTMATTLPPTSFQHLDPQKPLEEERDQKNT